MPQTENPAIDLLQGHLKWLVLEYEHWVRFGALNYLPNANKKNPPRPVKDEAGRKRGVACHLTE